MPTPPSSIQELQALKKRGKLPDFLFFWEHRQRKTDVVDQSCLSNWFPAGFDIDDILYPTVEHYMMAEKARLFGDDHTLTRILAADSPAEAKRLGRQIAHFDEATWAEERFEIVVQGTEAKFTQNPELRDYLLGTGDKILVEASPQDTIWGIGLSKDHHHAPQPEKWKGLNLLGFALMETRARLEDPNAVSL